MQYQLVLYSKLDVLTDLRKLTTTDLANLLKELEVVVDWYSLGAYLELPAHTLDTIERESPTIKLRLIKMIQQWLRTGQGCSWRKLVEALYMAGEIGVAETIRTKHLSVTTPVLPKCKLYSCILILCCLAPGILFC